MSLKSNALIISLAVCLMPMPVLAAINCTVSTVGVVFGTYDVFSGSVNTSTGTVTYNCKGVGGATITMFLSRGSANSFQPRQMVQAGGATLSYNLYLDATGAMIWGDGTGGSQEYGPVHPANNSSTPVTIFGQIPAGQDVTTGTYTDTIIATINF